MRNPFEYEAANNLTPEEIVKFYIEDYNYSRFLQSTKNVFLKGERGSGKTMALMYNSFKVRYLRKAELGLESLFGKVGIHIPCNTPIFHKNEHLLLEDEFKSAIICEHYLVLSIVYAIAEALQNVEELTKEVQKVEPFLKEEFSYYINANLPDCSFFSSVMRFVQKELVETQRRVNRSDGMEFYENAYTFASLIMPFLAVIKNIDILKESHFMLMMDDAHDLNEYQQKILNSWIAYRDHTRFSFKVATTKIPSPTFITSTGGSILEGHDFITVDMEKAFQNKNSDFAKLAKRIVDKRLELASISKNAEDFFPISPDFLADLEKAEESAEAKAMEKYPNGTKKQIKDYVYKYGRVEYYRNRPSNANRPSYSGFSMITDLSTGVIRNLLDPCYWMYDAEISNSRKVEFIPYATQNAIIHQRSDDMWNRLATGLDKEIENCSNEQAKQIHCLFVNLMIYFKWRLNNHPSEPRAIVFTISEKTEEYMNKLMPLLDISQKAQLLYTRRGSAKDDGKKEIYYVPNRMLLPSHGLDPQGQYARASLKASDLVAATKNRPFPPSIEDASIDLQKSLFDEI